VAQVTFSSDVQRHLEAPPSEVAGTTVREALDEVFQRNPSLRHRVLDDQGRLRQHLVVFVDGRLIEDRVRLTDEVGPASELLVMQALSGD
jgi:hypothetical protein